MRIAADILVAVDLELVGGRCCGDTKVPRRDIRAPVAVGRERDAAVEVGRGNCVCIDGNVTRCNAVGD